MVGLRVTNQMILDRVLNNFQANEQALERAEQRVSTGHAINQPSDNPFDASQVVLFHQRMGLNDQLQKNLDSAKGWLDTTDGALSSVGSALQRARQLAIQGANDTLTSADRHQIALEIHQLLLNAVDVVNSKFGDQYIFAGTKTTTQPFIHDGSAQSPNVSNNNPSPVRYFGDTGPVRRQIDQAAQLQVNVDPTTFNNVLADFAQLEFDLNNDRTRISGQVTGIDQVNGTTSGTSGSVETFSINGVAIGTAQTFQGHPITGFAPNTLISTVISQINSQSAATGGVTASVDRNGVLVLQLSPTATAKQIVIGNVDAVSNATDDFDYTNGTHVPVSTGGHTTADLGLSNAPENAIGSVDIVALDSDLAAVDTLRAQTGAKVNRVDEGLRRLSSLGITLAKLNSDVEDVDMAKAISELATRQTTFQAALGTAAKLLPPTLLDFLR